jgi:hypothetical protein
VLDGKVGRFPTTPSGPLGFTSTDGALDVQGTEAPKRVGPNPDLPEAAAASRPPQLLSLRVEVANRKSTGQVCREAGITEQTY